MSGSQSVNDPNAQGAFIRPRIRALFNGQLVNTPISISVESNNHFQADRFTMTLVPPPSGYGSLNWWAALQAGANASATSASSVPLTPAQQDLVAANSKIRGYGLNQDQLNGLQASGAALASPASPSSLLDIQLGFVPPGMSEGNVAGWTSLIQGEVDDFGYSTSANVVTVTGRDLTGRMIDTKTQNAYVNQTSSEIVTTIGQAHGLKVQATKTTTLAGRYWDSEHDEIQLNQFHKVTTEWDLICTLARFEGFDVFVQGNTLYFQPAAKPTDKPYVFLWTQDALGRQTGNVRNLSLKRSLTIAKGIRVTVKSWNSKQARSFTRFAPPKPSSKSDTQNHIYVRPNLTEEQAQQMANSIYADLVAHEMKISCDMIGDLILTPRSVVNLVGTGTAFDQIYYPQSVTKRVSMHEGFVMSVNCKNENPQSQKDVS